MYESEPDWSVPDWVRYCPTGPRWVTHLRKDPPRPVWADLREALPVVGLVRFDGVQVYVRSGGIARNRLWVPGLLLRWSRLDCGQWIGRARLPLRSGGSRGGGPIYAELCTQYVPARALRPRADGQPPR